MSMDDRFGLVTRDHRFRPIRQSQRKVQIDKRFYGIFSKKSFRENFTIDKRGRPIKESTSKNLRRFYHLSKTERKRIHNERLKERESLTNQLDVKEKCEDKTTNKSTESPNNDEDNKPSLDYESDSSYFSSEDDDSDIDLARGKGNVESSSDEEEDVEGELNNNVTDHGWGEMDNTAPRSEEISNRLALCSMDWDRVRAADIFILLDSFKPPGGSIKSVTIFPSQYGAERMATENKLGPAELKEFKTTSRDESWSKMDDEKFNMEKLRQYELNRLKYYYAVIVCDTELTGEKIYEQCDGIEFETSSSKLDLRFIPSHMEFTDYPPKETITSMPDLLTYKPVSFITAALNQTKVDLTWDETDHNRTAMTKTKFTKEQLEDMDVRDFLASSSGSEDEDNKDDDVNLSEHFGGESDMTEEKRVQMYRKLLLGEEDDEKENDIDMEVTWEPDLKPTIEQELGQVKPKKVSKKQDTDETVPDENTTSKAELEMIMLEDDFDEKKMNDRDDDKDFEIDVNDKRFSALYKTSSFAIDRSNSLFRKSDAMEKLVQERQTRVKNQLTEHKNEAVLTQETTKPIENESLSRLIKSVKSKSQSLDKKKGKLK